MLVEAGAKLGSKNSKGKMPIDVAANYGYKKIVEYVLLLTHTHKHVRYIIIKIILGT